MVVIKRVYCFSRLVVCIIQICHLASSLASCEIIHTCNLNHSSQTLWISPLHTWPTIPCPHLSYFHRHHGPPFPSPSFPPSFGLTSALKLAAASSAAFAACNARTWASSRVISASAPRDESVL